MAAFPNADSNTLATVNYGSEPGAERPHAGGSGT